ncbi:hypothetical protein THMIRHAS_02400 [Thiosulfatimonas sediminis]|uniref:DUF3616 domain-containing protein n=1 Tax=Thiosulfatimonas sediminis TaxID=2675054 RepID=A0A6F8PS57_9GAMM|nr:DUF3616 domain-containing protein [Thiosulfatimonas sediminis]BBP44867.1 hypothetical protein THMIRHAS_02400 [Thiosulfatimonas sediminis]
MSITGLSPIKRHLLIIIINWISFSVQANPLSLPNLPIDSLNISGIVTIADQMALVTDEGASLVLLQQNAGRWQILNTLALANSNVELDLEALAYQAPYLYALGSHSAKRKKVNADKTQKQNLQRLAQTYPEEARRQLFRIRLNAEGAAEKVESISLQKLLAEQPIIAPFIGIPSKENGIDIEALSSDNKQRLLVGFRAPVLRGNYIPVLRLKPEKDGAFAVQKHKWLWLDLDGRGIRGMSQITDAKISGQLLLAGAVGDQPLAYAVYFWDESDQLAGSDRPANGLRKLCDLPTSEGKPEGIQFSRFIDKQVEFLIVQDGLINGDLRQHRCSF